MRRETKNRGGGDPRSFPSSGFAVAAFAGAAGTAVATAGVLSLLSLANQMANNEKDNSMTMVDRLAENQDNMGKTPYR